MSELIQKGTAAPKQLEFPAEWEFRIIVVAAEADNAIPQIEALLARYGKPAPLQKTDRSKTGKYQTLFTAMTMPDRATLDAISRGLAAVAGVKMVI